MASSSASQVQSTRPSNGQKVMTTQPGPPARSNHAQLLLAHGWAMLTTARPWQAYAGLGLTTLTGIYWLQLGMTGTGPNLAAGHCFLSIVGSGWLADLVGYGCSSLFYYLPMTVPQWVYGWSMGENSGHSLTTAGHDWT